MKNLVPFSLFESLNGVIPGVLQIFDDLPELALVGTPIQYSDYLRSITDQPIVYKGLRNKSKKVHDTPNHYWFTPNRNIAIKYYLNEAGLKSYAIPFTTFIDFGVLTKDADEELLFHEGRMMERDFINNAKETLIRLDTYDIGGYQVQYVLNKKIVPLQLGTQEDLERFRKWVKLH